jgi:hypothetical protein
MPIPFNPGGGSNPPAGPGSSLPIPLTGIGGLFSRLGTVGSLVNAINIFRGPTAANLTNMVQGQFQTFDQNIIDSLYTTLNDFQNAAGNMMRPMQQVAQQIVIQMVNENMVQADTQLSTALNYLINQMKTYAQTVVACSPTAGASVSPLNIGNPVAVVSLKDGTGMTLENVFLEVATGYCIYDAQVNPSLAQHEPVQFRTQYSINDTFAWQYPLGSGISTTVTPVSGLDNAVGGVGNWLTNSSFETYSACANIPDSWNMTIGQPGITIMPSTASFYDGIAALKFVGDGAEQTGIRQPLNLPIASFSFGGTTFPAVAPDLQFACNIWLMSPITPASGILQVSLVNGNTVINDDRGLPNQFSVNLHTLSPSAWKPFSGTFRTPRILPTDLAIQLSLTTPLASGAPLFLDRLAMAQMNQLYQGGPSVAIFSGNINMIANDVIWLNIYNDYKGQFQRLFERLFRMRGLRMQLPSAVTGATIPDSLLGVSGPTGSGGPGGGGLGGTGPGPPG